MKLKSKRQQALRGTGSSLFLSLAAFLLLAGCSDSGSGSPSQSKDGVQALPPAEQALSPAAILFPKEEPHLTLRMLEADVQIGLNLEEAKKLLPRPGRSFPIQEIPEGLDGQFDVTGWEQGPLSIGMISAKGRVALFLEIQERADQDSALERVAEISDRHGLPAAAVAQGTTRYWFWEAPGERIMVCLTPSGGGRFSLSSALGNPVLMTALRMSPQLAQEDAVEAEKLLKAQPQEKAEEPRTGGS